MSKTIVSLCSILCLLPSLTAFAITARLERNPIPLYEVIELKLTSEETLPEPFLVAPPEAQFTSPQGETIQVSGFYDGQNERRSVR